MRFRNPSVRLLIALLVILPIVSVSGALVVLFTANSRRVAEDLGATIVRSSTDRITGEIQAYLQSAVRMSDRYARQIGEETLPTKGLSAWERPMLDDLITVPDVASICFGNQAGDSTWLLRNEGRLEVGWSIGAKNAHAGEFRITENGKIDPTPLRGYYQYDPRQRPWYKIALDRETAAWTPIYFWFGQKGSDTQTGSGFTRAVRDAQGNLQGVLVIDVTLGALSEYLRKLPFTRTGFVFIVDDQDYLVASSHGAVNSPAGARLPLANSNNPVAQAAAAALTGRYKTDFASGSLSTKAIDVGGHPARVLVTKFQNYPGIDWKIIVVIPESSFLAGAHATQRKAIGFAALAVFGSVLLGLHFSGQLARPIMMLIEHVRRVGRGDFTSRVHLSGAQEMAELSTELNKMAANLHNYVEVQQSLSIAREIQQSLLPAADPQVPGLDVAGRSHYCETTGGDYYDFIDVSSIDNRRLLIAVGDVVGHGIGAALLMAAARAAVRAHAPYEPHLAHLMRKCNQVLAEDRRHNQFMTLALMVIDPVSRTIRWANAGHDPAIIFRAATSRFDEVHGGDIPLGIETDINYLDYDIPGLNDGDLLIIGTDGIWDTRNDDGERFGKDRLREIVRTHIARPAAEVATLLEAELTTFRQNRPPVDDVTFVIVRGSKVVQAASSLEKPSSEVFTAT